MLSHSTSFMHASAAQSPERRTGSQRASLAIVIPDSSQQNCFCILSAKY